jgi:hypothetical protein
MDVIIFQNELEEEATTGGGGAEELEEATTGGAEELEDPKGVQEELEEATGGAEELEDATAGAQDFFFNSSQFWHCAKLEPDQGIPDAVRLACVDSQSPEAVHGS